MHSKKHFRLGLVVLAGLGTAMCSSPAPQGADAPPQAGAATPSDGPPQFEVDASWPKPYPNKWKIGGVTGLAVDKDDNVWVYNRPNDLTSLELQAERTPALADCCTRPPAMIHIAGHDGPGYKEGEVIESFDAPQGHGMAVDAQGFLYLGQNTVRKYDKTGKLLGEVPHIPENPDGTPFTMPQIPKRIPGLGGDGPVASFIRNLDADIKGGAGNASEQRNTQNQLRQRAFIAKYPAGHADARRRDRGDPHRRRRQRDLRGRQRLRRPRHGVLARHVRVQARVGRVRPQALRDQHQARGPRTRPAGRWPRSSSAT